MQVGQRVGRQQFAKRGRVQALQGLHRERNALPAAQARDDRGDFLREQRPVARQRQVMDRHPGERHAQQAQAGIRVAAQHAIERGPDGQAQDVGRIAGLLQGMGQPVAHESGQALGQGCPLRRVKRGHLLGVQMALDEGIGRPGKQMTARGPFECRVDGVIHLAPSGLPKPAGQIHAAWLRQIRHQPDQYLIGQSPRGQSGGARCQHGRRIGEHRDNQILRAGTAGRHQRQQPLVVDLRLRQGSQVFGEMGIREGGTTEFDHAPVALIMAQGRDVREDALHGRAVFFNEGVMVDDGRGCERWGKARVKPRGQRVSTRIANRFDQAAGLNSRHAPAAYPAFSRGWPLAAAHREARAGMTDLQMPMAANHLQPGKFPDHPGQPCALASSTPSSLTIRNPIARLKCQSSSRIRYAFPSSAQCHCTPGSS